MDIKQVVDEKLILQGEKLIKTAFGEFLHKDYKNCLNNISEAQKLFLQERSHSHLSICLSLTGIVEYFTNKSKYLKALTYINDGTYLAEYSNDATAKLINEIAKASLDFAENNLNTALIHFEQAYELSKGEDKYDAHNFILENLQQLRDIKNSTGKKDPLIALLKIGQTVAAETDINVLLKVIAEETKATIQADRCTVFLYDKDKNEIWSKVALGLDSQEIRFPASKGLAGHVVNTGETINIKDAYSDGRFNKEIDMQTGYKTKTILCMPIKNLKQEIIGAFQVLNKLNGEFTEEDEDLLITIGSNAGIAIENAQLFQKQQEMLSEQKLVFDSFIDTLAASIDARDKITSGHSSRVRLYSKLIAQQLELDKELVEMIEKAATLHDIGKIGIRDSVLQKEGKLTEEEYQHIQEHVEITHNILEKIHMTDEFEVITEMACSHHEKYNGTGYYRKLKGEEIHIGGRILAVSDVFDAITSKRHYRDKMPIINVIEILMKDSGSHFDKDIVESFLAVSTDKLVKVFLTENDMVLEDLHEKFLRQYSLMDLYNFSTKKTSEELTSGEKTFINLFNLYYTAKSNKENLS